MSRHCADCNNGIDHCHGSLVQHQDGGVDCTEHACRDLDRSRHHLVVSCDVMGGACECALPQPAGTGAHWA